MSEESKRTVVRQGGSLIDPEFVKESRENAEENAKKKLGKPGFRLPRFNPRHRLMMMMAAYGANQADIAKAVGFTPLYVSSLLKRRVIQKEVEKLQDKIYGCGPKKRYAQIFPEAVDTARDIMHDSNVKAGTRLMAARDFMDRHAGKPLQRFESEQTMVSVLISKLDNSSHTEEDKEIIDLPEALESSPETEEVTPPETDYSDWVNQNL